MGKSIAAYERTIAYAPSRFDRNVDALQNTGRAPGGVLSADEVARLRLFVGKANCVNCHNGPLLTNNEFHNTGVPARAGIPADSGRRAGADAVLRDEFNCRSRWSDARSKCVDSSSSSPATACSIARSKCRRCETLPTAPPTCTRAVHHAERRR
jgi:cytochrome c peroxidase